MSNLDDFDTTYRTVHGIQIIGYDAETDTFSKLHVDQNGQIYAKQSAENIDGDIQGISVGRDGGLRMSSTDTESLLNQILKELKVMNIHLSMMNEEVKAVEVE